MLTPIKTIFSLLATGLVSWTFVCPDAQAVPVTGSIAFAGTANATLGDPTTIAFGSAEDILGGYGDYSKAAIGADVSFRSISYTGTGTNATLSYGTIKSLWSYKSGGINYSFDLTGLTFANIESAWGVNAEALSGVGIAHADGMEDSQGTFSLVGLGVGYGKTFQFKFISGSSVPDGGSTAALLGLTLVGVEILRRWLQSASKTM